MQLIIKMFYGLIFTNLQRAVHQVDTTEEESRSEAASGTYHRVQGRHQAGEDLLSGRHQRLAPGARPDAVACQLPHLSHASAGDRGTQLRQMTTVRCRQNPACVMFVHSCTHAHSKQPPSDSICFDFTQMETCILILEAPPSPSCSFHSVSN